MALDKKGLCPPELAGLLWGGDQGFEPRMGDPGPTQVAGLPSAR